MTYLSGRYSRILVCFLVWIWTDVRTDTFIKTNDHSYRKCLAWWVKTITSQETSKWPTRPHVTLYRVIFSTVACFLVVFRDGRTPCMKIMTTYTAGAWWIKNRANVPGDSIQLFFPVLSVLWKNFPPCCIFIDELGQERRILGDIVHHVQGWAEVFRQNFIHHHQELIIEDALLNSKSS